MQKSVKRKTVLFFSDIVGYSKMIARDESHTLDLLNEHDIILEKEINLVAHRGDCLLYVVIPLYHRRINDNRYDKCK